MKLANRMILTAGCIVLVIISWAIVLNSKSASQKQAELLAQAQVYLDDLVYVTAIPLLEEAAGYDEARTLEAESALKNAYLQMLGQTEYQKKYVGLLEKQMNRKDASADVFDEAANFYLGNAKYSEAYTILKNGIAKTGDEGLKALYENCRYEYNIAYNFYEDVSAIFGTTIGVKQDGLWGLASSDGSLLVPCEYDKISTFSDGRAIALKDGEITAIDGSNNRLVLFKGEASDFGNYADGRVALLTDEGWKRATGDFQMGTMAFEQIGTHSNGHAAAKQGGKWGVVDISAEWAIPAEHDGVAMDELGRSYAQGAAFVKDGGQYRLFVDGAQVGGAYDDAKPFGDEGFAAVRHGGKWGFIDTSGELRIGYRFDDALSFGQHLAAVRIGNFWKYISLSGEIAIDAEFLQAKSFANGSAPVLTERGWQFITLVESRKGVSL